MSLGTLKGGVPGLLVQDAEHATITEHQAFELGLGQVFCLWLPTPKQTLYIFSQKAGFFSDQMACPNRLLLKRAFRPFLIKMEAGVPLYRSVFLTFVVSDGVEIRRRVLFTAPV